jgi:hypothetical protein
MVALNFDANNYEPTMSYDALPAGDYKVAVTSTALSSQGTGINVGFDIVEGEHTGRKIFQWLGLMHTKPSLVELGQQNLSSICRAVNKMTVSDTDELLGAQLIVKVKIQKKDPTRNEVIGHSPIPGFEAATPAPQQEETAPAPAVIAAQQTAEPIAAPAKAPWAGGN